MTPTGVQIIGQDDRADAPDPFFALDVVDGVSALTGPFQIRHLDHGKVVRRGQIRLFQSTSVIQRAQGSLLRRDHPLSLALTSSMKQGGCVGEGWAMFLEVRRRGMANSRNAARSPTSPMQSSHGLTQSSVSSQDATRSLVPRVGPVFLARGLRAEPHQPDAY